MMCFFPSRLPKGRMPERHYFFNILNTVHPNYTKELIAVAQKNRNQASGQASDHGVVKVSDDWWEKLNSIPFISSKSNLIADLIRT